MELHFPINNDFEYFLTSLTKNPTELDDDYVEVVIKTETQASLSSGKEITVKAKKLFYPKNSKISLDAVIRKIEISLNKFNHYSNPNIAKILLYCYSFIPRKGCAVKRMNELLSNNSSADLNQFIVFSITNPLNYNLKFGEFRFGTLDHERLNRYCKRFGTDYYDLYEKELKNRLAIERLFFKVPILNLLYIQEVMGFRSHELDEAFFCYFEELSEYYFNNFDNEFREQQNLMTFINDDFHDLNKFRFILTPMNISIFLNIASTKNGWIIPKGRGGVTFDFASSDVRYNTLINKLRRTNKFDDFEENELSHTMKSYLGFCAKAIRFKKEGLINEAFLHFVIALDLLMGEKESSTNSVANRTALICFNLLGESYHQTVRILKEIYNDRSKYVHSGLNVSSKRFSLLELICRQVFETLLNNFEIREKWRLDKWLNQVDLLIAMLKVEKSLSEDEFEKIGIIDISNSNLI